MWYLIRGTDNWADEMDVDIFDILTEDDYKKYMIAKEVLREYLGTLCIGTNEEIEEFDYLDFEPMQITDEDFNTLVRLGLVTENNYSCIGYTIFENLMDYLADDLEYYDIDYDNLLETTPEEFRKLMLKLKEKLDE